MSQTIFSEEDIKNRHITPSPAAKRSGGGMGRGEQSLRRIRG